MLVVSVVSAISTNFTKIIDTVNEGAIAVPTEHLAEVKEGMETTQIVVMQTGAIGMFLIRFKISASLKNVVYYIFHNTFFVWIILV